mmetsp:Transcript_37422/g.110533  ORF Transcript_37422/g.110533 Transcript_37422/m.110533 type:complete len:118 (-) Transcript_37422:20-373(-)|eukprot:359264-Chlamydomonas_euryale.AAC.5
MCAFVCESASAGTRWTHLRRAIVSSVPQPVLVFQAQASGQPCLRKDSSLSQTNARGNIKSADAAYCAFLHECSMADLLPNSSTTDTSSLEASKLLQISQNRDISANAIIPSRQLIIE